MCVCVCACRWSLNGRVVCTGTQRITKHVLHTSREYVKLCSWKSAANDSLCHVTYAIGWISRFQWETLNFHMKSPLSEGWLIRSILFVFIWLADFDSVIEKCRFLRFFPENGRLQCKIVIGGWFCTLLATPQRLFQCDRYLLLCTNRTTLICNHTYTSEEILCDQYIHTKIHPYEPSVPPSPIYTQI